MQPRISVIIPTYNRAKILARCFQALEKQTVPASEFEVVVCDDGSPDDTQSVIESFKSKLSIVGLRQENKGPAVARNRAIAKASAPLLLIINDDSILARDALERHIASGAYRLINIGTFRTPPELKRDFFSALVDSTTWIFPFVRMKNPGLHGFDMFLTANLSLPAVAIQEVGGFDESFPSPAGEDIELGYRLDKAGYRIMYDPSIECAHDNLFTPKGFARLRHMRGVEDMRFLHKNPELVGRYQDWCCAVARRWYGRIKDSPDVLITESRRATEKLDETVTAYNLANEAQSAERFRLMEKAYRCLDYVGLMSFVEGIFVSAYCEEIIGPYAVPFASGPVLPAVSALTIPRSRAA
jgi:glycosyltransferase involved in cell wall biosynthesis